MKKRIIAFISVAILLISLVSCSSGSYKSDFSKSESFTGDIAYDLYDEEMKFGSSNGYIENGSLEEPAEGTDTGNDIAERKIIKNADLTFQTKEYDAFMDSLNQAIGKNGGYVESSDIYGGGVASSDYYRNASITVRVPADRYDSFMESVASLGALTHKNEYIDDVTLRYVDIESRIAAYEAEYDALMELMADAESIDYIITLRQRISEIQYELESYKSQLRKYDDLISYCTINISVREVRVEAVSSERQSFGERIGTGLEETLHNIAVGFEDFSVYLIVNLPYILIWLAIHAVIAVVIIAIVRSTKKKNAKKKAAAELKNNEK